MEQDEEGFRYPYIEETKCIHCSMCEKVCPVLMNERFDAIQEEAYADPIAYGGWHRDKVVRADSSSGGAFALFADEVLKKDGVVYGAAFTEPCSVAHISVRTKTDLGRLHGVCSGKLTPKPTLWWTRATHTRQRPPVTW